MHCQHTFYELMNANSYGLTVQEKLFPPQPDLETVFKSQLEIARYLKAYEQPVPVLLAPERWKLKDSIL